MIVIVDEEKHTQPNRRFRQAPPVASDVRKPRHAMPTGTPRDFGDRTDDMDLGDNFARDEYGRAARISSPNGDRYSERNGTAAHRNMLREAMRSPSSPQRSVNEQRTGHALHSAANSIKDNRYGRGGSVDSFNI